MLPDVCVMIHIPFPNDQYSFHAFEAIGMLSQCIQNFAPLTSESWSITGDDYGLQRIQRSDSAKQTNDYNSIRTLFLSASQAHVAAVYNINGRKGTVDYTVTIKESTKYSTPIIKGERTLNLTISALLWKTISSDSFIQVLQSVCLLLSATYACIDTADICPNNIYTGGFRYFSDIAHKINPESKLPGVYWAQFISSEMVASTHNIHHIIRDAPCLAKELSMGEHSSKMWIQLPHDIWKPQIDERLKLRLFFQESLYPLSMDLLRKYSKSFFPRINLELLPLTKAELTFIQTNS